MLPLHVTQLWHGISHCRVVCSVRIIVTTGLVWAHAHKVRGCTRPTFGWLTAMLVLLLVLHVWWFTIFMKMGYDAIFKGITRDLQSQDPQLQRELREQQAANGGGRAERPKSDVKKA